MVATGFKIKKSKCLLQSDCWNKVLAGLQETQEPVHVRLIILQF